MFALGIAVINAISILLLTLSYRRMVEFTRDALRKELKNDDPNSEVDLEKCLMS